MSPTSYISKFVNVKIAPSPISGVGLFALRDILKDELLFEPWSRPSGTYPLYQEDLDSLDFNVRSHVYDMFQFVEKNGKWYLNLYLEQDCFWIFKSPTHWINSCSWDSNPNVDLSTNRALELIPAGNELLTKYGKYSKNEKYRAI